MRFLAVGSLSLKYMLRHKNVRIVGFAGYDIAVSIVVIDVGEGGTVALIAGPLNEVTI
jgi:hypothetical protein